MTDFMGMIDKDRLISEFLELVGVDAGTLDERAMADALRPKLEALGARVVEDGAGAPHGGNSGNLIAWLDGEADRPTILLSAHMDRVTPGRGIKPVIESGPDGTAYTGTIRSSGDTILAADDVAGLAAILEGLRVLKESGVPRCPVVVTFTIAEEGGLRGAKGLGDGVRADMGFIFDASGDIGTIITGAPHQVKLNVEVKGAAAHAGINPEGGINAIMVAAQALAPLKMGRVDGMTTSNFGTITAGGSTNIVPERAVLEGEVRSHDRALLEAHAAEVRASFERAAERNGASVDFNIEETYPGFSLEPQDGPAAYAARAITALGDAAISFKLTGGGSDANILNGRGIPSVALGIGFEAVHSTRESIRVEQLIKGAGLAAVLASAEVGA